MKVHHKNLPANGSPQRPHLGVCDDSNHSVQQMRPVIYIRLYWYQPAYADLMLVIAPWQREIMAVAVIHVIGESICAHMLEHNKSETVVKQQTFVLYYLVITTYFGNISSCENAHLFIRTSSDIAHCWSGYVTP